MKNFFACVFALCVVIVNYSVSEGSSSLGNSFRLSKFCPKNHTKCHNFCVQLGYCYGECVCRKRQSGKPTSSPVRPNAGTYFVPSHGSGSGSSSSYGSGRPYGSGSFGGHPSSYGAFGTYNRKGEKPDNSASSVAESSTSSSADVFVFSRDSRNKHLAANMNDFVDHEQELMAMPSVVDDNAESLTPAPNPYEPMVKSFMRPYGSGAVGPSTGGKYPPSASTSMDACQKSVCRCRKGHFSCGSQINGDSSSSSGSSSSNSEHYYGNYLGNDASKMLDVRHGSPDFLDLDDDYQTS